MSRFQPLLGLLALFFASVGPSYAKASEGKPNRLINEKSPYLLQHAYNPVDWYPWGEAAFQKAKRENKPIFLSIGYSTCHWCHVMERESFSNPEIAALMNKHFVSIKVDREERPDVDKIYMTAVSAMTGGGGWPLSAWLTPDLRPFYGGTYFPPDARWGRPGFPQILERLAEAWKKERDKVIATGDQANQTIQRYLTVSGRSGPLEAAALENGVASFWKSCDATHGGFRRAPKFPMPVIHNFLLRYHARSGKKKALEMSLSTLRAMARGGIYDHVGGGFHRYSTDAVWHIPHFEKMLYDNAQLAVNYVEAFQITQDPELARTARETLGYIQRDMTHSQGGFYSAEDADSLPPELAGKVPDKGHEHKTEGAFYVWEKKEILAALGPETGELFSYHYGVKAEGNASSDPHGEFKNKNILFVAHSLSETAKQFKMPESRARRVLEESRRKLLDIRSKRPRPHLDDKVLVSWNGLMITAFARAAQVFDDPTYLESARKAASFIRTNLYDSTNRTLYRRWREDERKIPGIADDYAFLVQGLIDLYETSFDVQWLEWAIELTETQNRLFYDRENGGFFMTADNHDRNLLVRTKEDSDNVEPAASSVAALNLLRLAQFTDRQDFRQAAEKTLTLFGKQLSQDPASLAQMLVALDYVLTKPKQIVIAGDPNAKDTRVMLRLVHDRPIPGKILLLADGGKGQETLARRLPFLNGITRKQNKATAYVCIDYACELPTNDQTVLSRILEGHSQKKLKGNVSGN